MDLGLAGDTLVGIFWVHFSFENKFERELEIYRDQCGVVRELSDLAYSMNFFMLIITGAARLI